MLRESLPKDLAFAGSKRVVRIGQVGRVSSLASLAASEMPAVQQPKAFKAIEISPKSHRIKTSSAASPVWLLYLKSESKGMNTCGAYGFGAAFKTARGFNRP
jgi:hypothetical protein